MNQFTYNNLIDEVIAPSKLREDIKEMTEEYLESVKDSELDAYTTNLVGISYAAGFVSCVQILQVGNGKGCKD